MGLKEEGQGVGEDQGWRLVNSRAGVDSGDEDLVSD